MLLLTNTFAPSEVQTNTLTTPTQYTLQQQQQQKQEHQQNKQKSASTTKSHSSNETPQPLIITTEFLQFFHTVFGFPASSSNSSRVSSQPIKFNTRPARGSPHPPQDKACAGEIDNEGSVLSGLLYNWLGSIPSPYGEDGPTRPKQTISCLAVEFS